MSYFNRIPSLEVSGTAMFSSFSVALHASQLTRAAGRLLMMFRDCLEMPEWHILVHRFSLDMNLVSHCGVAMRSEKLALGKAASSKISAWSTTAYCDLCNGRQLHNFACNTG